MDQSTVTPGPPPPPTALPWEAGSPTPQAFLRTLIAIIARPRQALAAPAQAGWPRALLYTALVWLLVFVLRYLLFALFSPRPLFNLNAVLGGLLAYLSMAAVFLALYNGAVLLALRLQGAGAAAAPWPAVLRAVCYSQTSYLAVLVPMVGLMIHLVWCVVLLSQALVLGLGLARKAALRAAAVPMALFLALWVLSTWLALRG
ncbi:MAG: hypothetical protein AB1814_09915 [Thermodesulfobacteriota bacterium]